MFYGSIPALITPFAEEGESIDYQTLEKLIAFHIEEKSNGLVVSGTTGEGPSYSEDEYKKVIATSIEASDGRINIIATSGTNDTRKSVQRTQIAKTLGANGALAIVPYYNKPNFTGIKRHFEEIANTGLPLIIYHHPGRTGITLNASELATLHKINNVVGIKEASDNPALTKEICELMPEAIILSGNDHLAQQVLRNGGKGSINVIGNLAPSMWHMLMTNPECDDLYEVLRPLIEAINIEVNPQGIKCAMAQAGYCENTFRLPLVPVTSETEDKISAANLFCIDAL